MSLEKKIENLIQVELDKHELMSENWFSIVEIGAMKRDIKIIVQEVADKIRDNLKDVEAVLKNSPKAPYFLGLEDAYNKVLGLLVEPSKEKTK